MRNERAERWTEFMKDLESDTDSEQGKIEENLDKITSGQKSRGISQEEEAAATWNLGKELGLESQLPDEEMAREFQTLIVAGHDVDRKGMGNRKLVINEDAIN